jgi:hypothetical protein
VNYKLLETFTPFSTCILIFSSLMAGNHLKRLITLVGFQYYWKIISCIDNLGLYERIQINSVFTDTLLVLNLFRSSEFHALIYLKDICIYFCTHSFHLNLFARKRKWQKMACLFCTHSHLNLEKKMIPVANDC